MSGSSTRAAELLHGNPCQLALEDGWNQAEMERNKRVCVNGFVFVETVWANVMLGSDYFCASTALGTDHDNNKE